MYSQHAELNGLLRVCSTVEHRDWSAALPGFGESRGPQLADLTAAACNRLAAEWSRDALAEHASIASFARFSLQLMAVGAPSALLADAQRAASDEARASALRLNVEPLVC